MSEFASSDSMKTTGKGKDYIPEQKLCNVCGKISELCCSVCRVRQYCSKACQKAEWKLHKKVCTNPKSTLGEKGPMTYEAQEHWIKAQYKMFQDGKLPRPQDARPTWEEYLAHMRGLALYPKDGTIPSGEVPEELGIKIFQESIKLFNSTTLLNAGLSPQEVKGMYARDEENQKRKNAVMDSFAGELQPAKYAALRSIEIGGIDITFDCVKIDEMTGFRQYIIMGIYSCHSGVDPSVKTSLVGEEGSQVVYICQTFETPDTRKPGTFDLKRAIHTCIMNPTGQTSITCAPHRPKTLRVLHRWGEDAFNDVVPALRECGIQALFQSREEAIAECAEAGTGDGTGMNSPWL